MPTTNLTVVTAFMSNHLPYRLLMLTTASSKGIRRVFENMEEEPEQFVINCNVDLEDHTVESMQNCQGATFLLGF